MKKSLYDYCAECGMFPLLTQWDNEKNGELTPKEIAFGSHTRVWWRCDKGHEWEAAVKERAAGKDCPVCAGRKLLEGVNDLASIYPELAKQWHPEKNGFLLPRSVFPGSRRKVWWQCEKGHEWQATIASRKDGAGCPFCSGKKIIAGENDLSSVFPLIAAEWHPTKNGDMTPKMVSTYSNRRVWWICEKGHEYRSVIAHRTQEKSACPYCSGRKVLAGFNDLASREPKIAAQWHPTLNGSLTPQMVTLGSVKRVWWICEEGHVWKAVIYSRAGKQKCGCPVCNK